MLGTGLVDPHVHVAAALGGDDPGGRPHQVQADGVAGDAVVRIDHELKRPAARAPGHLGVPNRMVVAVLPRHQSGEAASPSLDQVQPGVLVQGGVGVSSGGRVEQAPDGLDVAPRPSGS